MLTNFRYVGIMAMVFPGARIIHMRRDPIDTCLLCFSIKFEAMDYSFDLGELGRYHEARSRLTTHWRSVLPPGMILEVHYKGLVNDFARESVAS
jgi:hypothetical protein